MLPVQVRLGVRTKSKCDPLRNNVSHALNLRCGRIEYFLAILIGAIHFNFLANSSKWALNGMERV